MRKLCLAIAALVLGSAHVASAQTPTPTPSPAPEVYTLSATSPQVADLIQIVDMENILTCGRWQLPDGCTQGDACVAANVSGGLACTAGAARAKNARIYPQTFAGRDEFVTFKWAADNFKAGRSQLPAFQRRQECKWFLTATEQERNEHCGNAHLPPDCKICGGT